MKIRFHFDGVTPEASGRWRSFLLRCAANVELAPEDVDTVHVATGDNYAAVLQSLLPDVQPGRTHTDNEFYRGVARALLPVDGRSSIVVQDFVLVAAADYLNRLGGVSAAEDVQQAYEQEMFWYVLHHEFGHCRDHKCRSPRPSEPRSAWLDGVEDRYTSLMASEVAACAIAAGALTPAGFNRLLQEDLGGFAGMRDDLAARTWAYRITGAGLAELAQSVAEVHWFMLTQCAKHVATAVADDILGSVWTPHRERMESFLEVSLGPLVGAVERFLTQYPSAGLGDGGGMRDLWAAVCLSAGYRFEIDGLQAAMWLA